MKNILLLIAITGALNSFAQTMEQTMEKRARELHRVIGLNDKEQWKKFVQENYTKALIEKPMRAKVARSDGENSSAESKETKGTLEDKVQMFERLHDDFGGSKIVSIKSDGENLQMELSSGDLSGVFKFKFEKNKPYLIDGIGIDVEGGGR